jgi:hypothetical protein
MKTKNNDIISRELAAKEVSRFAIVRLVESDLLKLVRSLHSSPEGFFLELMGGQKYAYSSPLSQSRQQLATSLSDLDYFIKALEEA